MTIFAVPVNKEAFALHAPVKEPTLISLSTSIAEPASGATEPDGASVGSAPASPAVPRASHLNRKANSLKDSLASLLGNSTDSVSPMRRRTSLINATPGKYPSP